MLKRYVKKLCVRQWCLPIVVSVLVLLGNTAQAATVLVFGDSLSAAYGLKQEDGWVALLQKSLPEHQIFNVSISGETSGNGLARLPAALQQYQPDVLVIELGANDGLRGLPLIALRNNLQAMIDLGQKAGCRILLLGMQIPPNYGERYARQFADIYTQLAQKNAVALVPFLLHAIAGDPVHFQADHLHPTAAAQPMILATARPALLSLLEK